MTKTSGKKQRCMSCGTMYKAGNKSTPKPCPTCNPAGPNKKVKRK